MKGERRPDGTNPLDLKSGDYAKTNFGVNDQKYETWWIRTPNGILGRLAVRGSGEVPQPHGHEVDEHEDGTISVQPKPHNSNSILAVEEGDSWHGYIDHGEWKSV